MTAPADNTPADWKNKSILDYIGNTPLVSLQQINPNKGINLMAKLELVNPGGSIKARVAMGMINAAEKSGELTKDKVIVEATSGNTGIGLAMVCAVKGYRLLLAMSEAVSVERRKILKAYGVKLVLTPAALGSDGAIEYVYGLINQYPDRYFLVDQYNNDANTMTHYWTTANEIWEQTGGQVSAVVCSIGTTGTIMGIGKRLKELNPDIQIIGIEPNPNHKIQGLKNLTESYVPGIFDMNGVTDILKISDDAAFEMVHTLAQAGLFVGLSSGAAAAGALTLIKGMSKGTVVAIFPDGGERYLSTEIFSDETEKQAGPNVRTSQREAFPMLYNTVTRKKQRLAPVKKGRISIYTCGPTADRDIHLGYVRRYVATDLLRRYLEYKEVMVTHVVNITDIDDRTIQASEKRNMPLSDLTRMYINSFYEDIDSLNIKRASLYPLASQSVDDMVEVIEKLMARNIAYEKNHSVYFDISRLNKYGSFCGSGMKTAYAGSPEKMNGHNDDDKEDPMDFTLFKRATLGELKQGIFYKTQWGNGRPGWHIGCAAMSMKHLGETFDIYTCESRLIFPHNENVMAVAMGCTDKPLANYWFHIAPLLKDGKMMSVQFPQDLISVKEVFEKGYSGKQLRYFLLRVHYREPVIYSEEHFDNACKGLDRLNAFIRKLVRIKPRQEGKNITLLLQTLLSDFETHMDDDLDISRALHTLFRFVENVEPMVENHELDLDSIEKTLFALDAMDRVLMVMDLPRDHKVAEDEFDVGWCYRLIEKLRQ